MDTWIVVALVVGAVVVLALIALALRSRMTKRRIEQRLDDARGHREIAARQEQEADERARAAEERVREATAREQAAAAELAEAREERAEAASTVGGELERSERQRIAAASQHEKADEIEDEIRARKGEDDTPRGS